MPYAITGPAILKMFAPVPMIIPSDLNSRAGETTEFANPVIGTIVPAPACFAILSKTPIPVRIAAITINVDGVNALTASSERPNLSYPQFKNSPKVQINPPIRKALMQFKIFGDGGDAFSAILLYSLFVVDTLSRPLFYYPTMGKYYYEFMWG